MRVVVIMAGGSGERFWPLSRGSHPKQLLALTSDKTMLAESVERAQEIVGVDNVHIVAGPVITPCLRQALDFLPERNFIIEPEGRNTAPCLALATAVLSKRHGPDTLMGVMTADHLIRDHAAFGANVDLAFDHAAKHDALMTIGIRPTHANTGFGYLEIGPAVAEDARGAVHTVQSFREKPDEATAARYVESGRFLWNSGMFFWKISALVEAFKECEPVFAQGIGEIAEAAETDAFDTTLRRVFRAWPSLSIDYAVMEKAGNVAAVASRFDWHDVGTWTSLARIHGLDADGNYAVGNNALVDTKNCIVHNVGTSGIDGEAERGGGSRPLVATLGIEDTIVVVSGDSVLVCHRDREQDIKKLLEEIREQGHAEYL